MNRYELWSGWYDRLHELYSYEHTQYILELIFAGEKMMWSNCLLAPNQWAIVLVCMTPLRKEFSSAIQMSNVTEFFSEHLQVWVWCKWMWAGEKMMWINCLWHLGQWAIVLVYMTPLTGRSLCQLYKWAMSLSIFWTSLSMRESFSYWKNQFSNANCWLAKLNGHNQSKLPNDILHVVID